MKLRAKSKANGYNFGLNEISLEEMNKKFEAFSEINFTTISIDFHKAKSNVSFVRKHWFRPEIDENLMERIKEKLHIEGKIA